jgi:hypothetical protein
MATALKLFPKKLLLMPKKKLKKIEKKNVLVLRRPEDEAISLFAGLLAYPDVPLSLEFYLSFLSTTLLELS